MPVTYVDKIYYNNSQYSRGYKGSELLWAEKPDYFYIENLYNGLNTITLKKNGSPTTGTDIEWSGDLATWTPVTYNADNEFLIGLPNQNQKVWFRSTTGLSNSDNDYFSIGGSQIHKAGGDIRTLQDYTNPSIDTALRYLSRNLFNGDTNIIYADELKLSKLTNLGWACYAGMFNGCTSLVKVPELPATTLSSWCYYSMFNGCTSLNQVPDLPATTLAYSCYKSMFSGCTSLTKAPDLPATTLATECYRLMFNGCTSLTKAPKELPATTSAESCYRAMFQSCSALEYSPEIYCSPDSTTAFNYMFYGCSILHEIKIHSTTWDTTNTANWVTNVAASGWLYNYAQITTIPTGTNGIPTGWKWIGRDYFYIENRTSGTNIISISRTNQGWDTSGIYYFTIDRNSTRVTYSSNKMNINLSSIGERVYFLCDHGFSNSNCAYIFSGSANHSAGGDLRTLINSTNSSLDTVPAYAFRNLFFSDTKLVDISRLDLSKLTNVSQSCYDSMFQGCTGITSLPENMLPATTLASSCYNYMFYGCTGITRAPKLPAQEIGGNSAPYSYMFYGCTNLNRVEVYALWWYNGQQSNSWLQDTAASGDFYNIGGATIPTNSASGIPSGWTEHTTL